MPWILKLKSDWSFLRKYIRGARRFNEVTKEISDARLAEEESGTHFNDVVSVLLKAKDPATGGGLTRPELVSETGLFLIAGGRYLLFSETPTNSTDISRLRYLPSSNRQHPFPLSPLPPNILATPSRDPQRIRSPRRNPSRTKTALMPLPPRLHRRKHASNTLNRRSSSPPSPPRRNPHRRPLLPRRHRDRHPNIRLAPPRALSSRCLHVQT